MSDFYEASPLSTKEIRAIATAIRKMLNIGIHQELNLMMLLDSIADKLETKKFAYIVVSDNYPGFSEDIEAQTNVTTGTILIKESVYKDLNKSYSRSNFTIAHELGHYFLHHFFGVVLARTTKTDKRYLDPEWQADQFAEELLMPIDGIQNLSVEEIQNKYNVSHKAAQTRFNKTK